METNDGNPTEESFNSSPSESPNLSNDEKTWGMLAHLSGLAGIVGVPFGNILGPLIVWLVKKEEMPFVEREGKEALNFQISMMIYGIIVAVLCFFLIGLLIAPFLFIAYLILTILASVKAKEGKHYRYPFTIRFIS